jgi:hypothetical protein
MKSQTMNAQVTRLADWLLRIRARYEPMNGFTECANLLHEQQAYIESLEHQLKDIKRTVNPKQEIKFPIYGRD